MKLQHMGWTMPLIKDQGREKFVFTRKALNLRGDTPRPDHRCGWTDGQEVAVSICNVHKVLSGEGKAGTKAGDQGLEWRERIIEEANVFWNKVAERVGCGRLTDAYQELLNKFEETVGKLKDASKDQEDIKIWDMLLQRIDELRETV
jgi:hypothetical protein